MLQLLFANRAAVGAVVGIALLGGAYLGGRMHGVDRCEEQHRAAAFEATQKQAALTRKLVERDAQLAAHTLQAERRIQIRYRTVTQEVVKHVPVNPACTLNSAAVGLLNDALSGRLPEAPSNPAEPHGALPGPGLTLRPDHGPPGGEARGGVRPVLPVPGSPFGPI